MISRRSQLSGRSLAILVVCGALVGFTVPTVGSSIVSQFGNASRPHLVKPPPVPRGAYAPAIPAVTFIPPPVRSVPYLRRPVATARGQLQPALDGKATLPKARPRRQRTASRPAGATTRITGGAHAP